MKDLVFNVKAEWAGIGREGEGELQVGEYRLTYSAPANMGGKGVGASPEDLLLAAVTACYSGTLMRILRQSQLPGESIAMRTDGIIEGFPENARFARITVNPTIKGGESGRASEYEKMAQIARDQCFIGRTVRDSLQYAVGRVTVE